MVMHARKLARLNDGYYDRASTHPFEDKGSSKSRDGQYNDKYCRKESSTMDKHSPRYANKSAYKERVDRGRKSRSPDVDRRANHHSGNKDGATSSRHSNHNRSGSGSSTTFKEKKPEKDHKIEIQKSALRVCNDWSEHLSSVGKRYYYNCKTEVSKWEKPKDWFDDKAVKTEYGRKKEASLQKPGTTDRSKHSSSSSTATNSHSSRYNQSDRSASTDHKQHYKQSCRDTSGRDSSSYRGDKYSGSSAPRRKETVSQSALSALQNQRVLQRSTVEESPSNDRVLDSSLNKPVYRDKYGRDTRVDRLSGDNTTPRSRQGSVTPSATDRDAHMNNYRPMNDRRLPSQIEDIVNRQHEDMDISPGSTPTEESVARGLSNMLPTSATHCISMAAPTSTTVVSGSNPVLGAVAALPQLISQIGDKTLRGMSNSQANPQGTSKLNSAIQTLQKLQEALLAQQRQQQQQLATLIQQQLAQNQLSSAAASVHQPGNSGHQRTNGNMNSIVATSGASHPLLSPTGAPGSCAAPGHSAHPHTVAAASQGHSAHVVTSSSYVIHQQHGTAVAQSHHNQGLYVVTENGGHSPGAESAGTPLGSPELNLPDEKFVVESEKDTSQDSVRLDSPALSQSSSQRGVTGLAVGVTTLQRQESYKLPPSLSNYFKADLIPHVTGWPMEILERQADQIKNESHTMGNLYSTQVSCELKKARSLVRVSEIQSTLQEQRVLFLRQQIRDIEGYRNTSVSFMSPKVCR